MKYRRSSKSRGFTLVETVIAMGIITIMITAFFAAFAPAVQGIRKSISAKDANRLASTLEAELSVLKSDEVPGFTSSFQKAFDWIELSGANDKLKSVLIYQYRGDPNDVNEDGTLKVFTGDGISGEDFLIQTVARRLEDIPEVENELVPRGVIGRVFYVRMTQMVFSGGELIVGSPGQIVDPNNPGPPLNFVDYPEGVIALKAEFFPLESNLYEYVFGPFDPADLGKPAFTRSIGVRR